MAVCLVTGAAGFVGANLVRRLLVDGHDAVAVVQPGSDDWRIADLADVRVVRADLVDGEMTQGLIREVRPQWIFHLAAHGAYSWQVDRRRIVEVNLLATAQLIDACLDVGFEALVHAGSSSEYGPQDQPTREDGQLEPLTDYAISKAAATLHCQAVARRTQHRIRTLRLYSVYGRLEEPGRLLPTLIAHGLEGGLPPLAARDAAHDFVHVDDVARAFVEAAASSVAADDGIYNIGCGRQTSLEQVVSVVKDLLGVRAEPNWGSLPQRVWDTTVWVADNRRAQHELGWSPSIDLESGVQDTIDWLMSSPPAVRERYRPAARPGAAKS